MSDPIHTPIRKSYLKPLCFSLMTLASGIVIGAAAAAIIFHKPPRPDRMGWEYMSHRTVDLMTGELHLTPEQVERIQPILQKRFESIDAIRNQVRPQIRQEFESMNEELMSVLDPQQQQLWQDRIKRMQDRFPRMHQRGGPGPDGRPDGFGRRDGDRMGPGPDGFQRDRRRPPWPPTEPNAPDRPFPDQPQP